MSDDGYEWRGTKLVPIWTPRGLLARGHAFFVICECGRGGEAPLVALIAAGDGEGGGRGP